MGFEVVLRDGTVHEVERASAYEPEGPMTTFFVAAGSHQRLSAWSVRIASFRTDTIASVKRRDEAHLQVAQAS